MTRPHRFPRRLWLGPHVYVDVALVTVAKLKELGDLEEALDGLWLPSFEDEDACLGVIYIDGGLSQQARWKTLRHELIHAINDIDALLREAYGH